MDDLWEGVLPQLRERLGTQNFETWIKPIRAKSPASDELALEVPNKFFRDWLAEHFLASIQELLGQVAQRTVKVSLSVNQHLPPGAATPKRVERESLKPQRVSNLIPKYNFENFVVGASNQFAHAASLAVANQPGDHYNPLFIYGGVGLEMDEFRTRFRNSDVLILDDIQFIAGKERTQEEFFHTFNSLYESHKQIILTSDKFPKEISDLEDRLRNRFEWGLIADIQPPDVETRVAILQKKAETEAVPLPHDVAIFLASNIDSNVRELEGSLTRLGAFASLTKTPITVELAKEVLQNTLKGNQREVTVESIQKTICDYFNLKLGDLKAKRRTRNIALPRQLAMYLCRKYTSTSFPSIGDKFGGRDHSTVIHAAKTIEKKIKADPQMSATIEKLEKNLTVRK
ncbi:MAG: dnaA [Deltaproteobacteria bacterium]|nr:dnaA [Deltaproteobacteria bacterium]